MITKATVAVIGAGQAGLSAAYHLSRRGFVSALGKNVAGKDTCIVFDAEDSPGGAWLHRQKSLTMATVNGIFDLPGMSQVEVAPSTPAREAVPAYFAAYEHKMNLPIVRPVTVQEVRHNAAGGYIIDFEGARKALLADAIINATGTWTNPVEPDYPGLDRFTGRQLHSKEYVSKQEFKGLRVAVVGGGISAVQQLAEVSDVAAKTYWYTRSKPRFRSSFTAEEGGRQTIEKVTADTEAGRPPRSIVSYTGLIFNQDAKHAYDNGALKRRPMFSALYSDGVIEQDGQKIELDAIIWAIGFRPALSHLAPLHLINDKGGIDIKGTRVIGKHNLHLIGYGPSQSTVGANRAGRDAVICLIASRRSSP